MTADRSKATVCRIDGLGSSAWTGKIVGMRNDRDFLHDLPVRAGRGFTLVELMVTLAVVAILAMLGVPQMQAFLKRQQVKADIDSLTSAVRLARSEAMKRSGVVSVCPLQSANASPPTCAVSPTVQSWSQGWIVFVDYAPLGALGDNDTILKVEQGTRTGKVISRRAMANMSFQSLGISTAANGSFNIGDDGLPSCKQLFLSRQGRARTSDCADTTDPDTP